MKIASLEIDGDPSSSTPRYRPYSFAIMNDHFAQPIDGILDLHTFRPEEIKNLVPDYLEECRKHGVLQVRIIHGKGTGTARNIVRSILKKLPFVRSFRTAGENSGGWGATMVELEQEET